MVRGDRRLRHHLGARHAALAVTAFAVTAVSACSSETAPKNDPKPSPTVSTSQSAKPVDPAEAAKTEAIGAYKLYWGEMEKLYADSTGKKADLKRYAASAALKNAEADASRLHDNERLITGVVGVGNSTVTKIDINRTLPNATISTCLDVSAWQVVDSGTKKPVALPTKRLTKYVIVSTLERWQDGWKVIKDEPKGTAC